ncbi:unnamed protein product [Clonostachys rhizophaga]|uniref:Glutamine amidotransferase domain-containing protein n=1 Tax=Clonostachys rhizophaga TaxID=160324 RepID=A0A9N9V8B6_9HYPO|nr:unnamed protein product [Clonostachys rhizophaga]
MSPHKSGPCFAIVQNFKATKAAFAADMISSFSNLIRKSAPDAIIDVFNGVEDAELPDPRDYAAVFLTGGMFNLALPDVEPWVARELEYILTLNEKASDTKLVGICWGHQAVARALGGSVEFIPTGGHVVGRKTEKLVGPGKDFFDADQVDLIHFRLRWASKPGGGAVLMAEDNSILYYPSRNILTLQGHPEFTSCVSHGVLDADGGTFSSNMDVEEMASTRASFDQVNDGEKAFASVMDWVLGRKQVVPGSK